MTNQDDRSEKYRADVPKSPKLEEVSDWLKVLRRKNFDFSGLPEDTQIELLSAMEAARQSLVKSHRDVKLSESLLDFFNKDK